MRLQTSVFISASAVFSVGKTYQIMAVSDTELLFWVEAGGKRFYDHANGVIRSRTRVHRAVIPAEILDSAGEYAVCYRRMIERKGDYSVTGPEERERYCFRPIPSEGPVHIYQVADAHQKPDFPQRSAGFFDRLDLLIVNGDTFDYLDRETDFDYLYRLLSDITAGEIPVVFAKGNHDNKGVVAEKLVEYAPTDCGKSYYTFRLGRLWGIVLDCGENCADESPVYGNTVCHHIFREEETEWLRSVIKNAEKEYLADGVEYRIVISHAAITNVRQKPFDIEVELYREWVALVNQMIKPDLMLSGHLHITALSMPGSELDTLGQSCPVIIGANPVGWQTGVLTDYIGCALTLSEKSAEICFTNAERKAVERHCIDLKHEETD